MASYNINLNGNCEKSETSGGKLLTPLFSDLNKIECKLKEITYPPDDFVEQLFKIITNSDSCVKILDNIDVKELVNTVKEKWADQIKRHRDIHTTISKFGKTADKVFSERIDHLNSYFKKATKKRGPELLKSYNDAINSLIFDYLLRIGRVDVAAVFIKEEKVKLSNEEKQTLEEVTIVIKSMKNYNFEPLKEWVRNNKDKLSESQVIEFYYIVSKLEFLNALSNNPNDFSTLIECAKGMAIYARFFQPDFEYLMGSLAFIHNPERISQFYSELFQKLPLDHRSSNNDTTVIVIDDSSDSNLMEVDENDLLLSANVVTRNISNSLYYQHYVNELVSMFSEQVCVIKQSTLSDPLFTLFSSGIRNITEFFNHDQIFKKLYLYNKLEDFPLTVKRHDTDFCHSIFHCPVDKTIVSGDNTVIRLKCGHAISKSAFTQLTKNEQKTKMKCPYCPQETRTGEVLTLIL